jgi:hypothetical protein
VSCPFLLLHALSGSAVAAPLDPSSFAPLAPALVSSGEVTIDTEALTLSMGGASYDGVLEDGVAVFAFGEVELTHALVVRGTHPLALLAAGDLTLSATLDASAAGPDLPGRGGFPGGDAGHGGGPGGGRGDVLGAGGGGFGGGGGAGDGGVAGGPENGDLLVRLRGGSGGGSTVDVAPPRGGSGGGAVELGAGGRLVFTGEIRVDGGRGQDAEVLHGGGGGAGGAVLLHAAGGGSCSGLLSAEGGAGGAGSEWVVWEWADGGGGGGGRVALVGVDAAGCAVSVSGGEGPFFGLVAAEDGEPGELLAVDPDDDGDGYTTLDGADCDDRDPEVHPTADEIPCNGIDDDCDPASQDCPGEAVDTAGDPVPDGPDAHVQPAPPTAWFCGHAPGAPGWALLALLAGLISARRGRFTARLFEGGRTWRIEATACDTPTVRLQ